MKKLTIFVVVILSLSGVLFADIFTSHLKPNATDSLDIGTGALRWNLLEVNDVNIADDLTVGSLSASQAIMTDSGKTFVSVDYLNQSVKTTASPTFGSLTLTFTNSIHQDTSDGDDWKSIAVSGGGAYGANRGAFGWLFGNEYATTGWKGRSLWAAGDVHIDDQDGSIQFETHSSDQMILDYYGNLGLGLNAGGAVILREPNAKFEIESTTEQLRLSYDVNNYISFTVDSNSDLAVTAGGGDISFGDANLSTTGALSAQTVTAIGTVTANRLTDGTATLTGGTLTAVHVSAGVPLSKGYLWLLDDTTGDFLRIGALDNAYTANRTLSIDLGNQDRTLTFSGGMGVSPTISDWFDHSVKMAADVTHNDLTLNAPSNIYALSHDSFADFEPNEHINWVSCANDFNTTGTLGAGAITGTSLAIDATIDHTLTDDSNDLVISNLNEDKDIILSVNDGGTQKDFITVDSSKPALMLDPGTVTAVLGLIDCGGTFTTGNSYVLNFHPAYSGAGGMSGVNIDIDLTGTAGATAQGIAVLGNTNASQSSGTQTLYGVRLEPDLKNSAAASVAYGTYFYPAQVILTNATTRNVYGSYIGIPQTATTAGTVNQYGTYLTGWGSINEVGGTINSYAYYSDGGDEIHAGNLRIGDTTDPTTTLDVVGDASIGDDTNDTLFSTTGVQTMAGDARVMIGEDIDIAIPKRPAANPPAEGPEDGFPTLDFDDGTDESILVIYHLKHRYASAGTVHLHLDYFVDTAPAADANVVWALEYKKQSHGDNFDFGGTSTLTTTEAVTTGTPANDKKIHETENFNMTTTGWEPHDIILMRVYRDADNTSDNFTGDSRLFHIHIEFLKDKLGEAL